MCMDAVCSALFTPCGHLVTCSACAACLHDVCPICSAKIEQTIEVEL